MERRDLFRILAASAAAPLARAAPYKPRFFRQDEYKRLDDLCETILPADEESGGAKEAGVAAYIDTVVLHSSPGVQTEWRNGLADLEAAPLDRLAERDGEPFFMTLKGLTIQAFFQSKVGFQYCGYKGEAHTLEFPGCNHPEHR